MLESLNETHPHRVPVILYHLVQHTGTKCIIMTESDFNYAPEDVKREWGESGDPNPEADWGNFMNEVSSASIKVERAKWAHFTPEFLDTNTTNWKDTEKAAAIAQERRDLYSEQKMEQLEAHVEIPNPLISTIVPIGDVHWGSIYTNYELFDKHRKTILETPGLYTILMHNLVDNGIPAKFPANTLANGVPPQEQFRVMQAYIKELDENGKILGAVMSDCHEGWSGSVAGVSAAKLLYGYEGRNFPILENGGLLHVGIGEQRYVMGLWHKQGPFNSRFNPEHALRQNRRLYHEGSTDVEIGAHYHNAAASATYEGSKGDIRPVHWIRVGCYKGVPTINEETGEYDKNFVTDKWIVDRAGVTGQPGGTSLTLWSDRHMISDELDFDTSVEKHMAMRSFALIKEMGLQDKLLKLME